MTTPTQIAAQIAANLAHFQSAVSDALLDTAEQVRDTERTVTHKVTGHLADAETPVGPSQLGSVTEVSIEPVGVPYAELEALRGGSHNFAERGLEASAAHIEALRQNLERVLINAIEGIL